VSASWPGAQARAPFDLDFGDARAEATAALHETVVVPLAHVGLIAARGADTEAFLQGQLSNDVRDATAARAQLTSYNSPKGRMLAVLNLWREADGFVLEVHRGVLEPVLKRLRLHVLRSQVKLEDVSAAQASLGVAGKAAARTLEAAGFDPPAGPYEVSRARDIAVTRRPGKVPRFTLRGAVEALAALWPGLAQGARPAGTGAWRLLEIEAGMPTIYPETQDRFVAQMCNLDQLGGISFSKGCYTGQEVVARVHYLGAVKRHMVPAHLPGTPPAPGTRIDAGELVDAALHPDGGSAALVVSQGGET